MASLWHKSSFIWICLILLTNKCIADFTDCPSICECKWSSGFKVANCSSKQLEMIPENLNPDMQILLLENNPIYEVPIDAFEIVGLQNLKKIVFKNCKLMSIHKDSFRSLKILIELDLSNNKINRLHKDTFVHTERLRWISLNNNLLEELDDGLFRNLGFLQTVILTNNHIHKIGLKTFQNLPFIKVLQLAGNNLTHMSVETISSLKNLTGLDLHRNPWKCDCNLQEFRDLVIKRNLYNSPTDCREPIRNRGRLWKDMDSSEFACKPSIIYPSQTISVEYGVGENITLTCKVAGNPKPEVNWKQGTRIIDGDNKRHGDHRFSIKESDSDVPRWVNLSIINLKYHDRSEYSCIAKNPGGEDEKTISLTVSKMGSGSSGSGNTDAKGLYIGLAVGIIILMIVVALLCYCFCRKRNSKRHTKSDMHSSNGEALIEGSVIPEMEKSLITTVNPVTKPPRRYDAPLSITSGATEMSELNKTLLDNDSIFAANENENRSMEFIDNQMKQPRDTLSVDSARTEEKAYPPDLLSFPARGGQASPAASTASTAPDSSRLLPQSQSPLHSPIYSTNPNLFKTLPYSRSQSPFTSPVCPPIIAPRQGYVTIPRRPRVPSWSSTTSSLLSPVLPGGEIVEPVYDNLGLRTTADGSSVLSLNKTGLETPQYPATMRGRPLPATPTTMYAPIKEHEQPPSPAPQTPYNSTLSRLNSNSLQLQLSPNVAEPQEPIYSKQLKNKDGVNNHLSPISPLVNGRLYDSISNSGTLGRSGKIPPRPPPKPTKKSPSQTNGPLFEDEGEDGTEV